MMSSNDTLIKINQLYKIFGDGQENALELVKNGIGKEELLEKSNCVLGLNNINLNIKKQKYKLLWVSLVQESLHL
jgi:glycine betaine/proline transport system ATP-binding protein